MPLLGAHMSIAGGYYKAVEAAAELGMDTCQIFTKNNAQWRAKPISPDDVRLFRNALERHQIRQPVAHSSYLINLASPSEPLWTRSVEAMVLELERAEALGIPYVVVHPGACTSAAEEAALGNVIRAVDQIQRQTRKLQARILLETTAGQGSCVGWRFEQLAYILQQVREGERLGVCLDTCHVFAAGYALDPPARLRRLWSDFDRLIGLDRLRAMHLNDSKRELGSRVDRHEHIGRGRIGLEPFRRIVNDRRLQQVPMYLETPKGTHEGQAWDAINLATLRGLLVPGKTRATRGARP